MPLGQRGRSFFWVTFWLPHFSNECLFYAGRRISTEVTIVNRLHRHTSAIDHFPWRYPPDFHLKKKEQHLTEVFMVCPSRIGVIDTYSFEPIHPHREGRTR